MSDRDARLQVMAAVRLQRPWISSIVTRMALAWAIFIAVAVGLSGWLISRANERELVETLRSGVRHDAHAIAVKLETWADAFREDARFAAKSPLLREFMAELGTGDEARWRALLEDEFAAMLEGKPAYFQMRVLAVGGESDGREILRLDRRDGTIAITPPELLQSKAGRSYFLEAKQLPDDEIYLSEANLNRDFGGVTVPHIPTLRAAARVRAGSSPEALLIINADLRGVFREIRTLSSPVTELRIAAAEGDYLLHPDPRAQFARDLGGNVTFGTEYPEAGGRRDAPEGGWLPASTAAGADPEALTFALPTALGGWPPRRLRVITSLPGNAWQPMAAESRRRTLTATGLASLAGAAAAFLLSFPLAGRLRSLSEALRTYRAGSELTGLPEPGPDEVGLAVERLQEMADRVQVHVRKLEEARREAEEATHAKEEFLAVMSHEIRTPMNAVVGLIRALEANRPGPHQEPLLASLRAASSNLMALLNSALDYSKLKAGRIEFSDENFDAAAVAEEVARSYRPSAMAKGLRLDLKIEQAPLPVRGDPVRLRQVLNNLVGNAVKFTRAGSLSLRVGKLASGSLQFTVTDTGPGIPESQRDEVFQKFSRTGAAARAGDDGAGLGLAIARALVELQGGAISLESEPGEGSAFRVEIPFREADANVPAPGAPKPLQPLGPVRILCIEDVELNRVVIEDTLAGSGADVTFAATASEALTLVADHSFDVALVDLQLPDMRGEDLAERLRESHPRLPLIAVTAQTSGSVIQRCRESGIASVVFKPFEAETLIARIRSSLPPERDTRDHAPANGSPAAPPDGRPGYAALAAGLLDDAAGDLARTPLDPPERFMDAAAKIRHRLATAISVLSLDAVRDALEAVRPSPPERDAAVKTLVSEAAGLRSGRQSKSAPSAAESPAPSGDGNRSL